jgi:uncharacterized protein
VNLTLTVIEGTFAICRLDPDAGVPSWARAGNLWSITRSADELSIVCEEGAAPESVRHEGSWRILEVQGPFEFSAVGIISSLAAPLAAARIGIFVISTFDTDYLLLKQDDLESAAGVLSREGHEIRRPVGPP